MAVVPYTPFSTAQPQPSGEKLQVNTPGAAFGENIGAALKQLGGTTEQAGGELFNRAIALQDLANENAAREAQTDFALKSSQMHADFAALTGKAAKDALPKFLQDQSDLRSSIGNSLGSPMAKKFYDADSTPFMQRNVFSAATHAAEENKKYTVDTLNSTATSSVQAAAMHPDDEDFVNQKRSDIAHDIQAAAFIKFGTQDPNDPNVTLAVNNALSAQRAEQILSKAKTNSPVANEWAQKYKGDLTNPTDAMRVSSAIENHGAVVYGNNVATSILASHKQPDGTYNATGLQMEQEARDEAAKALPGNELAPDTAAKALAGKMYLDRIAASRDLADARHQFIDIVSKGNIHDAQTFLATPGVDQLIPRLPPDMRTAPQLQVAINNFNKGVDRMTSQDSMRIINGMRTESSDGGAAFQAIDPKDPKWGLSSTDMIKVQNQQYEMSKHPASEPRVENAMRALLGARGAELKELGVDKLNANNADDYYHFRGALLEGIENWQQDHNNKLPTSQEVIDQIGPQIIKSTTPVPGFFSIFGHGTTSQDPAFRHFERPNIEDIPQEAKDKMLNDFNKQGLPPPNDFEMVKIYSRQLFNQFYKKDPPNGQ